MGSHATQDQEWADGLRQRVLSSLEEQGFRVTSSTVEIPDDTDKSVIRTLHATAVQHKREKAEAIRRKEVRLIANIAAGAEVVPQQISPQLIEVQPRTDDELLFRYAALHWSIPISSGYGRRIRFLVRDAFNGKLMGIIGLGDPVFSLRARDSWIGWTAQEKKGRLRHVLDAFVLGAVPPYSSLLGGKLVAMLAGSEEVRSAFERKYSGKKGLIAESDGDSRVAAITTTSALGRSSMYNRLRFDGRLLMESVGFTVGSGEFHFTNGMYSELHEFASKFSRPSDKNPKWGDGFRNRREVVRKALSGMGLSSSYRNHGVRRQVYVAPLAKNTKEFLRGEDDMVSLYSQDCGSLSNYFRERWLLKRAENDERYKEFDPQSYLLWPDFQGRLPD